MQQVRIRSGDISTTPRIAELPALLKYKNEDVVLKFCKEWDVSQTEAEDIFEDTKKFLYLAAHCKADCFSASIYHQFQIIDEMWHSFLQFTDQYADFCEAYLGGFLHHFPFSRSLLREQMKLLARTQQTFASYKQETFARQLAKTKDLLGDDTLIKWYGEYAHRYNVSQLNALRKPIEFDSTQLNIESLVTPEILALPKEKVLQFILDRKPIFNSVCGCSGKGCGAGCYCNSPHM
ncbi:hypothetical protein M1B34_14255 [Pseudomonas sp. MAFF 302030]|uniref:Uncharacterized protein n=1 Tax=Pseudomonas morbosilactucae TaxID=2938197 RepID=A0A9X1YYJ2_9PSED|nr:hypothetical protein [Pseudomonas morbosilactucae]MCK9798850.1 hypothetical protein [Pseudomonas morbosilactucae]